MKLHLHHKILFGAGFGAIAIGGINHQLNTMPCLLLSPGAKQMCELAAIPDTLAAAWSGFTIFGTITAMFLGLAAFLKPKQRTPNISTDFSPDSFSSAGELYGNQLIQRLSQPLPQTAEFNWNWLLYAALGLVLAIALNSPIQTLTDNPLVRPVATAVESVAYRAPPAIADVAKDMDSIAVLAIGHAEGNMTVEGKYTDLIKGHIDPSMIGGRKVLNKGWCSNYGKGGNLEQANLGCLERTRSRINLIASRMTKYGLPPEQNQQNFEFFLNILDQWNQASPRVSDVAPKKAAKLYQQGLRGFDLIVKTRVEAFRDEGTGQLSAAGLFNICANPANRAHDFVKRFPYKSEKWRSACIDWDQRRRATAIRNVLKYRGLL